jgi:hypothetical protein
VAVKFGTSEKIEYFVYNRREALEKKLRDRVLAWWEKHIVKNVAPAAINDSDAQLLDLVYIAAPDKILKLYEERKTLKEKADRYQGITEEIKAWVRKESPGKTIVQFPDESTLGTQSFKNYSKLNASRLKTDGIDLEKYKETTTSVCFKLS